jgi:hypothetical protein
VPGTDDRECPIDDYRIVVLDDEPPSRLERADEARKRCITLGHMNKHEARVNEIESSFRQRIGGDIVTPHFEIGAARVGQEARIDVRHEDMTFDADTIGQPLTYRPVAASYFQAPPAPSDPGCQKMASGVRVMQGLETREPQRRFAFCCVVKNVARHFFPDRGHKSARCSVNPLSQ